MSSWDDDQMLIAVPFDVYAVIDHMYRNWTYEQVMEFIEAIDDCIADVDFTQLIIKYAKKQKKMLKAEMND